MWYYRNQWDQERENFLDYSNTSAEVGEMGENNFFFFLYFGNPFVEIGKRSPLPKQERRKKILFVMLYLKGSILNVIFYISYTSESILM